MAIHAQHSDFDENEIREVMTKLLDMRCKLLAERKVFCKNNGVEEIYSPQIDMLQRSFFYLEQLRDLK